MLHLQITSLVNLFFFTISLHKPSKAAKTFTWHEKCHVSTWGVLCSVGLRWERRSASSCWMMVKVIRGRRSFDETVMMLNVLLLQSCSLRDEESCSKTTPAVCCTSKTWNISHSSVWRTRWRLRRFVRQRNTAHFYNTLTQVSPAWEKKITCCGHRRVNCTHTLQNATLKESFPAGVCAGM